MEIGEYQKQTSCFYLVPRLGHDPRNGKILSLLFLLERHESMVVKSTRSGCYFLAGQVTYLLCASVLLIGKGGVLTVPSGIDVVCHTDRPSRLRHAPNCRSVGC